MITAKTCEDIWHCYREIAVGEKLLSDMAELKQEANGDQYAEKLKDAFGRRHDLQLGIPSGSNSHRLIQVAPDLAESIIRAHIANKKAELIKANERARIEVGTVI